MWGRLGPGIVERTMEPQRTLSLASIAVLLLCGAAGCKYTNDDVNTWKNTVKGPAKMESLMLAPKYEIPVPGAAPDPGGVPYFPGCG